MKQYLINLLVGITSFFLLTESSFAETTMSEEGQYILQILTRFMGCLLMLIGKDCGRRMKIKPNKIVFSGVVKFTLKQSPKVFIF